MAASTMPKSPIYHGKKTLPSLEISLIFFVSGYRLSFDTPKNQKEDIQ
jgi:hypothetical protein